MATFIAVWQPCVHYDYFVETDLSILYVFRTTIDRILDYFDFKFLVYFYDLLPDFLIGTRFCVVVAQALDTAVGQFSSFSF